jgi:hypothetical protein
MEGQNEARSFFHFRLRVQLLGHRHRPSGPDRGLRPAKSGRETVDRHHRKLCQRRHEGGGRGQADLRHRKAVQLGLLQGQICLNLNMSKISKMNKMS